MITLTHHGNYALFESVKGNKILVLGNHPYAWMYAKGIGAILSAARRSRRSDHGLAAGTYRVYNVIDEPKLTDLQHLELSVGRGWQGYLLLTGLPRGKEKRRIVPTDEVIGNRFGKHRKQSK